MPKYRHKQVGRMFLGAMETGLNVGDEVSEAVNVAVGLPFATVGAIASQAINCTNPQRPSVIDDIRDNSAQYGFCAMLMLGSLLLKAATTLTGTITAPALTLLYTPYYLASRSYYDLTDNELRWMLSKGGNCVNGMNINQMNDFIQILRQRYQPTYRSSQNSKELATILGVYRPLSRARFFIPSGHGGDRASYNCYNQISHFHSSPNLTDQHLKSLKVNLVAFITNYEENAGSRLYREIFTILHDDIYGAVNEHTCEDITNLVMEYAF